jgi:hypothetical protein
MDKLIITAHLKTPVIFGGGFWTLDGLLAGIIFDQTEDIDAAHGTIPLACSDGLFHASAALVEPVVAGRKTFVAALRANHSLDPALVARNRAGTKLHTTIGEKRRREFGNVLNTYRQLTAPEVTWLAEGDGDAVKRLVDPVQFIGKRRASGYGEISHWTVEPGDLNGVVGIAGEPLRPVPVERFDGDKASLKLDCAWRPAYWNLANRAICYAPQMPL